MQFDNADDKQFNKLFIFILVSLNSTSNDTTEIHTICRITSGKLIADAQSIVTRVSTNTSKKIIYIKIE